MLQVLGNILNFGAITFCVSSLLFATLTRSSRRRRRWLMQQRKKEGRVNIGAIFGMDIGGTLTKIVYFEANMNPSTPDKRLNNSTPRGQSIRMSNNDVDAEPVRSPGLKKNRSFVNLEEPEQKAALQELYEYIDLEKELAVRDEKLTFHSHILGGQIHFLHFETRNMMEAINYLSSTAITENIRTIGCTGGGGHKYSKQFADQLQIKVVPLDELGCLVRGMDFCLTNVENECYTYRPSNELDQTSNLSKDKKDMTNGEKKWQKDVKSDMRQYILPKEMFVSKDIFPYLVVNIGSGVSILKITSPGKFERVSGSSVGGGTYWGLCRLLTSCSSYEKVLDLAETGNAAEVDMLVKDIYGGSYDQMNLNASMVASSFGKLVMKQNPREGVKEEDLAIALLMMITNNIGQGYFGALGTFLQSAFENDLDNILDLGHVVDEDASETNEIIARPFRKSRSKDHLGRYGKSRSDRPALDKLFEDTFTPVRGKRYRSFSSDSHTNTKNSKLAEELDLRLHRQAIDGRPNVSEESETYATDISPWRDFQSQSLEWMKSNFMKSSRAINQESSDHVENKSTKPSQAQISSDLVSDSVSEHKSRQLE